jgi:FkbM family methyltransferase
MNEFDLYRKYITKGSVAYDIGAHIGVIAIQMKMAGAEVYAFEPSPNNFPHLNINCSRAGIKCFDIAVHEKTYQCLTQFKDCRTDYKNEEGKTVDTFQQIKYCILEDFIKENNLPMPNFIKLDIEGMESVVLKTFKFLFESCRPTIYVEIHAQSKMLDNQNYENNPHWVWPEDGGFDFNSLKDFGYKIIINNEILSDDLDWNPQPNSHSNMILIPA